MNTLKLTVTGLLLVLTMEVRPQTTHAPDSAAPDLDWIAGHWCLDDGKQSVEEHWLPARGG
jgi:hypothetical protein